MQKLTKIMTQKWYTSKFEEIDFDVDGNIVDNVVPFYPILANV